MKWTVIVCLIVLILFYFTGAALWADWKGEFPWPEQVKIWGIEKAKRDRRKDLAVNAFFALMPPSWFASPFMTGFYRDGFDWKWMIENPYN